ncbi:hypothetical protein NQ317_004111 [Molorchus minor]|uniref:Uncharacterized protein n=1 Tax=Molorchus minor TaxID=1323400 RepID=A0ABQ9J4J9_9CUCU|nr:hypothetical protein NQ317_004111 [Molorchus minor]
MSDMPLYQYFLLDVSRSCYPFYNFPIDYPVYVNKIEREKTQRDAKAIITSSSNSEEPKLILNFTKLFNV